MQQAISFWSGGEEQYRYLSNSYLCNITLDDKVWPTVEHYYQAQKYDDECVQEHIRQLVTGKEAKQYRPEVPIRKKWWAAHKENVMCRALKAKFRQHPDLAEELLATGDTPLMHYAPWDPHWGTGPDGKGDNRLGILLVRLRSQLLKHQRYEETRQPAKQKPLRFAN